MCQKEKGTLIKSVLGRQRSGFELEKVLLEIVFVCCFIGA